MSLKKWYIVNGQQGSFSGALKVDQEHQNILVFFSITEWLKLTKILASFKNME